MTLVELAATVGSSHVMTFMSCCPKGVVAVLLSLGLDIIIEQSISIEAVEVVVESLELVAQLLA